MALLTGLDYTSHDDILPYTSTEEEPFHHQLFSQFFTPVLKDAGMFFLIAKLGANLGRGTAGFAIAPPPPPFPQDFTC